MKNKRISVKFSNRITNRKMLVILLSEHAVLRARIQFIESLLRKSSGADDAALDAQHAALMKASCADLNRLLKEYSHQP